MTIRNVHFGGTTIPEQQISVQQQTPQVTTNPIQKQKPDLISQDGANALRAYTLQNNLNFTGEKKEVPETSAKYIEQLKSKGLEEGKDFTIERDGKFTEVHLMKNGQTFKDMVWFKEDTGEVFECYRLQYHSQNNPIEGVTTCYGGDGKFRYRAKSYEKNPIKNDDLDFNTTPEKYMEYLKQNNLKYTIDYNCLDDDKFTQIFSIYNPKTDLMTKVAFDIDEAKNNIFGIHKEYYDSNNEVEKVIHYGQDHVEITDFKEKPIYKT